MELDSNDLTLTRTATFGGSIQGDSASQLIYDGTGTQTLTGTANLGRFECDRGTLVFDGGISSTTGTSLFSLLVDGGDLEIRGGGVIDLPDTATAPTANGLGAVRTGSFLITGSGSTLSGSRFDVGISNNPSSVVVINDGLLDMTQGPAPVIYVGFGSGAATGLLEVALGGRVAANDRLSLGSGPEDDGTVIVEGSGSSINIQRYI